MRFGVRANVGEARGIGHFGGLAGFGVGPAFALLELDGVVVEELVDGDGGQHEGLLCSAALQGGIFLGARLRLAICRAEARRYMCRARRMHRDDDGRAGQKLLNFAELFVARVFAGDNQFRKAEDVFDVADVGGLGKRFLDRADR